MFARPLSTVLSVTALTLVTACSTPLQRDDRVVYDNNTYTSRPVPYRAEYSRAEYSRAEFGRVENIGHVQTSARTSGAGAVLGAVIGGVIGNQIGSGGGKALATGAGVIGGAVAGNAIENRQRRDDEVFRVHVRFDNGSVREFDFQRIDDLRVGDRVKFEDGQLYRV